MVNEITKNLRTLRYMSVYQATPLPEPKAELYLHNIMPHHPQTDSDV